MFFFYSEIWGCTHIRRSHRAHEVRLEKNIYVERQISEMLGANDIKPSECVDLTKLLSSTLSC